MLGKLKVFLFLSFLAAGFSFNTMAAETAASKIQWTEWNDSVFETAKKENRFVILDLHAVWCHWCHVMEETTYRDPKVVELIQAHYLPVEADQDSHLDLSSRYEEYGWPATIIFSPEGKELAKRRGYIEPEAMASLLKNIVENPSAVEAEPEVKTSENAFLTDAQKTMLRNKHDNLYDKANGGWGKVLKLILPFEAEYALRKAGEDAEESARVMKTLDLALHLLDPVWGGFYQYSDEKDWKSPHYEKIMWVQTDYMRLYSLAYGMTARMEYLNAAEKTAAYLKNFLQDPSGAFYTSQDADVSAEIHGKEFYAKDDAGRRAGEMPRIDKHIYSRENGWVITGLTALYDVTGKAEYLESAKKAADWIEKSRSIAGGKGLGFTHDDPAEEKGKGPYLGDTLAMGRGFLALYASTGERGWLKKAEGTAVFMNQQFKDSSGGFSTSKAVKGAAGVFQKPFRNTEENTAFTRFANLLFHYTGKKEYRQMAEHAMRYLSSPALIENKNFLTGILLADSELATEPDHIVIVGRKNDPAAQELYKAGLAYPSSYKRIEWWDKREGPMPNPDVKYPELGQAAAFACANKICSLPVFKPEKVAPQLNRLRKKKP